MCFHSLIKLKHKRQIAKTSYKKTTSSLQWASCLWASECAGPGGGRLRSGAASAPWAILHGCAFLLCPHRLQNIAATSPAPDSLHSLSWGAYRAGPCCHQEDTCTRLCLSCSDNLHRRNHSSSHSPLVHCSSPVKDTAFGLQTDVFLCVILGSR